MQRYSSGSTSCDGLFHNQTNSSSSFSMLFSVPPPNYKPYFDHEPDHQMYSSVDCTLSLGTPSTRLPTISDVEKRVPHRSAVAARVPNFCWDILQGKHAPALPTYKPGRGSSTNGSNDNSGGGGDPLLARRCANCDTTSTPLWRNGPRGPKSLCNACGIRFKKEERRASAATTGAGAASGVMEPQRMLNTSCVHYSQSTQKVPCFSPVIGNEFRFIDGDDRDAAGIPFLSWRLNVTDRPGLVHD